MLGAEGFGGLFSTFTPTFGAGTGQRKGKEGSKVKEGQWLEWDRAGTTGGLEAVYDAKM